MRNFSVTKPLGRLFQFALAEIDPFGGSTLLRPMMVVTMTVAQIYLVPFSYPAFDDTTRSGERDNGRRSRDPRSPGKKSFLGRGGRLSIRQDFQMPSFAWSGEPFPDLEIAMLTEELTDLVADSLERSTEFNPYFRIEGGFRTNTNKVMKDILYFTSSLPWGFPLCPKNSRGVCSIRGKDLGR